MKYYFEIKEQTFDTYISMDESQIIMPSIRKQTKKIVYVIYDLTNIKFFKNAK